MKDKSIHFMFEINSCTYIKRYCFHCDNKVSKLFGWLLAVGFGGCVIAAKILLHFCFYFPLIFNMDRASVIMQAFNSST
ncbi:uncharacterized protein ACN427_012615 isoform 2-T2 [Glossina fuscipes fuscipes]